MNHSPLPYSPMSPAELTELELRYGRELNEREALFMLRREREHGMREELYGERQRPGGAPANAEMRTLQTDESVYAAQDDSLPSRPDGSIGSALGSDAGTPELKPERVTAEEIACARFHPRLFLVLGAFIVVEAWAAVHVVKLIEGWLR